jgi:hypothetical protein
MPMPRVPSLLCASFLCESLKVRPPLNIDTAKNILKGNFREREEMGLYIVYSMSFSVVIMVLCMFKQK